MVFWFVSLIDSKYRHILDGFAFIHHQYGKRPACLEIGWIFLRHYLNGMPQGLLVGIRRRAYRQKCLDWLDIFAASDYVAKLRFSTGFPAVSGLAEIIRHRCHRADHVGPVTANRNQSMNRSRFHPAKGQRQLPALRTNDKQPELRNVGYLLVCEVLMSGRESNR